MNRFVRLVRRRTATALLAPLSLAIVSGAGLAAPVSAQDATPTPGVLATPAAEIDCSTLPTAPSQTYQIVSEESEARYRAQEELAGRGANEAVGKTTAFIGSILLDANGAPLACSRFDVDLRTLQSDEARRDNFLYTNTLETETYPLATFVLTEVPGLNGGLPDGQETTITLVGNLTLHGVTKLVSWEATVTKDGDELTGSATTSFDMPDFAITPPKVGPVVSLDERVVLEVDIAAKLA